MNSKYIHFVAVVLVVAVFCDRGHAEELIERTDHRSSLRSVPDWQNGMSEGLPGIAVPSRQVTMSCPMEGTLMELYVQEGCRVEADQVLAVMDNRVAQAAVATARAAAERMAPIELARQELLFSKNLLERFETLRTANAGSEFEVIEARTRVDKAKAALLAAQEEQRLSAERLKLELTRLETHSLRAPFAGQILRVEVLPGTTLTRDDDLLTLVRLTELEVELHVPLDFYNQLDTGNTYRLLAGAPVNKHVLGRLDFVAPMVDAATRTYRCIFTVNNEDLHLPAGFSVRLEMRSPTASP
jgi:RND family efflux transporter MFP subunit